MKTIMTMVYRLWNFVPRGRHHYNNSQVHRKHSWCWPSTLWCVSHKSQRKLPVSVMVSTPLLCLTLTGVTQPTMVSTPQHLWQLTACTAGISHIFSRLWSIDCETLFHKIDTIITTVKFTANTAGADHQLYGVYLIVPNGSCQYLWWSLRRYCVSPWLESRNPLWCLHRNTFSYFLLTMVSRP